MNFLARLRPMAVASLASMAIIGSSAHQFNPAFAEELSSDSSLQEIRPGSTFEPTRIQVGMYVLDISKISDAEQLFLADVFISTEWQDDRLAHEAAEPVRLPLNAVWHPRISIFNARNVATGMPEEVTVTKAGVVRYIQRFSGAFSAPLDLHRFPRDEQLLRIQLLFHGLDTDQVTLGILGEQTGQSPEFTIADWQVEPGLAFIEPITFTESISRPAATYQFKVTRDMQYYIFQTISPLILIVLMSWTAFWIKIGDVSPKLAMGASSMLTLIAYRFYLSGLLPKISYMTTLDYFVMGSTLLVSATLAGTLVINFLHERGHNDAALATQVWGRFTFPPLLLILISVFLR